MAAAAFDDAGNEAGDGGQPSKGEAIRAKIEANRRKRLAIAKP